MTVSDSSRLIKAAIISIPSGAPIPTVVVMQYNPEQLTRSIAPKYVQTGGVPIGGELLAGPAEETITLTAKISAVDQLANGSGVAGEVGLLPQLAALEVIMYPQSIAIMMATAKLAAGTLEITPSTTPLTLFAWGFKRVMPVQLTGYSVTETLHDPNLNPINADVSLTLKVLTYQEFTSSQAGYYVSIANLVAREAMSALNLIASGESAIGANVGKAAMAAVGL